MGYFAVLVSCREISMLCKSPELSGFDMEKKLSLLYSKLEKLESQLEDAVVKKKPIIDAVHRSQVRAAKNLIHYITFRSYDIRPLQMSLHKYGLSALTSSESHILCQIRAVLKRLGKKYTSNDIGCNDRKSNKQSLMKESIKLFGAKKDDLPHIMVTFDKSFTDDIPYLEELLSKGMDVARINCAHDDEETWLQMIGNLKIASEKTGFECKVYMDLAGPKIRSVFLGKKSKKSKIKLEEGSLFLLAEKNADFSKKDIVIGCSYGGIVAQLKKGEPVLFDDGEIEAVIKENSNGIATLEVVRNSKKNFSLKANKGINFPKSTLNISSLTEYDKQCIPFICENADLLGYSFVREPADLAELQSIIHTFAKQPKIIIKIETPESVNSLPALLLQGMQQDVFGVMIARGDLAVELGFERLSEMQDEILWFCEAGHVPVIWATQVLETLHKTGIATRSEMTDAAHASMAECVMINKGEFTLEVIETLKDVLKRNLGHRNKKYYMMRPLQIARKTTKRRGNWGVVLPAAPSRKKNAQ